MLQFWLQPISFLCCSEAEWVSMCIWERGRERGREGRTGRQHVHQRATYRTLDSRRSASFLPFSFLPPFSSLCLFISSFYPTLSIVAPFTPPPSPLLPPFPLSLPPLTLSIPAVLPPFVPALHAEDDTSNFEEPEQAAPRPASAAQQGAPPVGFQGRDLPFLGWFFSRALTTLAKTE